MVINNISVHAGLYVFAVCMWCVFMFLCFCVFIFWELLCILGKTLMTSSYLSCDLSLRYSWGLLYFGPQ